MLTQPDLGTSTLAVFNRIGDASSTGMAVPLSQAYIPAAGLYDEMFTSTAGVRPHCQAAARLLAMTPDQLETLRAAAERMLLHQGVTFNVYSENAGTERIFPLDVMPRIIDHDSWSKVAAGLIQRVRALNAFVADVY